MVGELNGVVGSDEVTKMGFHYKQHDYLNCLKSSATI